jgi:hypothetical protein
MARVKPNLLFVRAPVALHRSVGLEALPIVTAPSVPVGDALALRRIARRMRCDTVTPHELKPQRCLVGGDTRRGVRDLLE